MNENNFKIEKAKARKLRQSQWWKQKLESGVCHYCGGSFSADALGFGTKVVRQRFSQDKKMARCCRVVLKSSTSARIIG